MHWSLADLVAATNGQLSPGADELVVTSVTIDSRRVPAGALFVPLRAERDGHAWILDAVKAGAAAYFTDGPRPAEDVPTIEVKDTAAALSDLGRAARRRLEPRPVVGITGSVGKTSTKDLTAAALAPALTVAASEKSFNNELGVPLTLANAPDGAQAAVVEMGARGVGHIAQLCEVARPTIGVVTAVALAHTELFGSIDGVAAAKAELIEALPATGTAILNADDPRVAAMAGRSAAEVLRWSTVGAPGAEIVATGVTLDEALRPSFTLSTPWGHHAVRLGVSGAHHVGNALAAAAVALRCGVPLDSVADGLATARLSPWRMELRPTPSGATVINDAYNANPASMAAALRALAALPAVRRVAVLGVMAELGDQSPVEHRAVAGLADELGIELLAVGTDAYGQVATVADIGEAVDALGPLDCDTAVLVKASRVAGLERLAQRLTERLTS